MPSQKSALRIIWLCLLIGGLILSGCKPATPTPETEQPAVPDETQPVETVEETEAAEETETEAVAETEETAAAEEETDVPTIEMPQDNSLPADPIPQTFQASDGMTLEGLFYPSAYLDAPLVVLMHWAPGDQHDWAAIARWLQNRGVDSPFEGPADSWMDAAWFPAVPEEQSYNVFTFTFRGCQGGCKDFDREGWLQDVEAAMIHAAALENIDPDRVLAIGASIGADGAAYGCHYYNQQQGVGCRGALSFSPGGYLMIPYPQEVEALENETPPIPAWCFFAIGDGEAAEACQGATGALYQTYEYDGADHGMRLIVKDRSPNPLDLILDFVTRNLWPKAE